jgi:hypothetical protein
MNMRTITDTNGSSHGIGVSENALFVSWLRIDFSPFGILEGENQCKFPPSFSET